MKVTNSWPAELGDHFYRPPRSLHRARNLLHRARRSEFGACAPEFGAFDSTGGTSQSEIPPLRSRILAVRFEIQNVQGESPMPATENSGPAMQFAGRVEHIDRAAAEYVGAAPENSVPTTQLSGHVKDIDRAASEFVRASGANSTKATENSVTETEISTHSITSTAPTMRFPHLQGVPPITGDRRFPGGDQRERSEFTTEISERAEMVSGLKNSPGTPRATWFTFLFPCAAGPKRRDPAARRKTRCGLMSPFDRSSPGCLPLRNAEQP